MVPFYAWWICLLQSRFCRGNWPLHTTTKRNTLNPWAIKWAPKQNTTVRTLSCQNSILQDGSALLWFLNFFLKQSEGGWRGHSWQGWSTFPKKFWPNYGNFYFGKVRAIEIDNCNALFKYHHVRLDSNLRQTWVTYYFGEKVYRCLEEYVSIHPECNKKSKNRQKKKYFSYIKSIHHLSVVCG